MWDDADVEDEAPGPEAVIEEAPVAEAEAAPEDADTPAPEAVVKGTDAKILIFKHWVRPKFLQYTYMYDYRRNYYDEVIKYMDRRNRGIVTDMPRAQTWGERALRTYLQRVDSGQDLRVTNRDAALLRAVSTGARFHRYHSKSMISRKYSTLGFNTVSI